MTPAFACPRRLACTLGAALALAGTACERPPESASAGAPAPTPTTLAEHCRESIGEPRVIAVTPAVAVAIGYDLANTIRIHTPAGPVIVDAMMNQARASAARAALLGPATAAAVALIYTHSHIDHTGAAVVWAGPETAIWATAAFTPHFLKQYGQYQRAEQRRGMRQFARHAGATTLPCSALGRPPAFDEGTAAGVRLPGRTFSGRQTLDFGGMAIELVEAHGETDDQLFVWIPSERTLLPGDNYYAAFPNLYTIRGTRPRPVGAWIESLDTMRRLRPEHLVPSHTAPVSGAANVQRALTAYRDAIAWVRHAVIRGANAGHSKARIVAAARLPAHLAAEPFLQELYGQTDWSAQAIYDGDLGWFDERPETLYPLPVPELARAEIGLMGGAERVRNEAARVLAGGNPRLALHLLAKLEAADEGAPATGEPLHELRARALEATAAGVTNTNGRGYLLESAWEARHPDAVASKPIVPEALLDALPVRLFFEAMPARLAPERSLNVHEALAVTIADDGTRYTVTVRRGVAELAVGEPLPGTPEPVAHLTTAAATWKRLALQLDNPAVAVAAGKLEISGNPLALVRFLGYFDRGL